MKVFNGKTFWGAVISLFIICNVNAYALENQEANSATNDNNKSDETILIDESKDKDESGTNDVLNVEDSEDREVTENNEVAEVTEADVKEASKNGWVEDDGRYYYYVNGRMLKHQWLELGGYKYYLDGNGIMYCNCEAKIDYYIMGKLHTDYYRFDQSGHNVIGWYRHKNGNYVYYGKDGRRVNGLNQIDGDVYYFDDSKMVKNGIAKADNYVYYFGEDGKCELKVKAPTTGWVSIAGKWAYVKNGSLVGNQWIEVSGYKYYMDSSYIMCSNTEKYFFDEDDNMYYCGFDKAGHMVKGWFTRPDGRLRYYDNNGRRVEKKLITVKGKKYYFEGDGDLLVDEYFSYGGNVYRAEKNGVCNLASDEANGWKYDSYYVENGKVVHGWKYIDNNWYYFDPSTGEKYHSTIKKIGNHEYCFNYDGRLMYGWINYKDGIYDENGWNYAKPNGRLIRYEWLIDGSDKYYFGVRHMATGIKWVDGGYKLFSYNGRFIQDIDRNKESWYFDGKNYYYIKNGRYVYSDDLVINGKRYYFKSDGLMATNRDVDGYYYGSNGAAVKNTWVRNKEGNYNYYGDDGKIVKDGWKNVGGTWYYFEDKIMCTSECIINNVLHHFRKNGAWINNAQVLKTGWYMRYGQYYYYDHGERVSGFKNIKGTEYYFDYDGSLEQSRIINEYENRYYIDKDGKVCSGWCNNGKSYGRGRDSALVNGLVKIGSKKYYFYNYELQSYDSLSEDQKELYIIKPNGEVTKTIRANGTGWYLSDQKKWYYQYEGTFAKDEWIIGNKRYMFADDSGEMITNEVLEGAGYISSNGEIISTGWHGNEYLPVVKRFEDYKIMSSNEKKYFYYFGLNHEGVAYVDGGNFYYDGKGNRRLLNFKEGWNKFNNNWYYVSDGRIVQSKDFYSDYYLSLKIGGLYYYFRHDGRMVSNSLMYLYDRNSDEEYIVYLGENGQPFKNGWKLIDGKYYYFDRNGHALIGNYIINSVKYLFNIYGVLQ